MSYETYKVLHLLGIMLLFACLGGLAILTLRGGEDRDVAPLRKLLTIGHGVSLLVVFVAGFGLMARIGIMKGWPTWIYAKLALWLMLLMLNLGLSKILKMLLAKLLQQDLVLVGHGYAKWRMAVLMFALLQIKTTQ